MNECYLEHTKIKDKFTSIGWYNDYYIKGDVTGIDSLMCGEQGCEYAAIINVKEAYLAEYVPIFWSFNRIVVVTYLINLIIVLPVLVIIWLVNIFSRNKKEKPS